MSNEIKIDPSEILNFWFSERVSAKWFDKDVSFDDEIRVKFLTIYEAAVADELDQWQNDQSSILALIILLDQFPRNMFRGKAKSFATDFKAVSLTKHAISKKMDVNLNNESKQFLYMPLMHSENLEDQKLCFELFSYNTYVQEFAKRHMDIIIRFGRFPHRNAIVGRKSTSEEISFLNEPNSSF